MRKGAWPQTMMALLAAIFATRPADAQTRPPTLESLAAAWSGSAREPSCKTATHIWEPREIIGQVCVWRQGTLTWAPYELGGHRPPGAATLAELTWNRSVPDSAAALQLRDSLATAFKGYAVQEHKCSGEGRMWQAAGFYVHFTPGVRQPQGGISVMLIATTVTLPEITQLLCPGVVLIPPLTPGPRGKVGLIKSRGGMASSLGVA